MLLEVFVERFSTVLLVIASLVLVIEGLATVAALAALMLVEVVVLLAALVTALTALMAAFVLVIVGLVLVSALAAVRLVVVLVLAALRSVLALRLVMVLLRLTTLRFVLMRGSSLLIFFLILILVLIILVVQILIIQILIVKLKLLIIKIFVIEVFVVLFRLRLLGIGLRFLFRLASGLGLRGFLGLLGWGLGGGDWGFRGSSRLLDGRLRFQLLLRFALRLLLFFFFVFEFLILLIFLSFEILVEIESVSGFRLEKSNDMDDAITLDHKLNSIGKSNEDVGRSLRPLLGQRGNQELLGTFLDVK